MDERLSKKVVFGSIVEAVMAGYLLKPPDIVAFKLNQQGISSETFREWCQEFCPRGDIATNVFNSLRRMEAGDKPGHEYIGEYKQWIKKLRD